MVGRRAEATHQCARRVTVHRGGASHIIKVPEQGGVAALRKQALLKFKIKSKALSLFRRDSGEALASCGALETGTQLCLCTQQEMLASRRCPAEAEVEARKKTLPVEIWDVVVHLWLQDHRRRWYPAAAERLQSLRGDDANGDETTVLAKFTSPKGTPPRADAPLDESSAAQLEAALTDLLNCSMVCKTFHRAIGTSEATHLLGKFFWRNAGHGWVPYSARASWDMEIAYITSRTSSNVAICEPRQDTGKTRRRHVVIDLVAWKQRNVKARGRELDVIRRPRVVV